MKETTRRCLGRWVRLTWADTARTAAILAVTTAVCLGLRRIDDGSVYVAELYLLAVFLVSRFTDGYFYGMAASLVSVLAVNYIFTFPYFAFNFTIAGYPLTAVGMLAVAGITSTMTTQIKRQGLLRIEAEREKTRGNLLRAVSHDLRTPLTSILGASSALADHGEELRPQERQQLAREIRDDAQWLIRMVENLLSVTRMDDGEGRARLRKQPEAAEEVVGAAVMQLGKRFPECTVSVSVPEELLMVPMDALLIEQVLLNLLENAVIHGKGATQVGLSVERRGSSAAFRVWDDGCGIDPEVLPLLFERTISHEEEGRGDRRRSLGIGLTVCATIIRAHGGRIIARNRPQGGAEVEFTLPLEEGQP